MIKLPVKLSGIIRGVLLSSCFTFSATSLQASAESNSEWVISNAEEKLIPKIEEKLDEKWKEEYLPELIKTVLGEEYGDPDSISREALIGLLGGVPGMAFNVFLGAAGIGLNSGPSEMELMTEVILKAIEASEERIISAIEESFQKETEDRLSSLYKWWNKYNSSDLWQNHVDGLLEVSHEATTIRQRLEQNGSNAVDSVQLYILIVSLEMQIDKHITMLYTLLENPSATESMIAQEYSPILRTTIEQVSNYLIHGEAGKMRSWVDARHKHKAGHSFFSDGHSPVAEILDSWRAAAGFTRQRAFSEVEWSYAAPTYSLPTYNRDYDNPTGHYIIKFNSFQGNWISRSGTVREISNFADGSSEIREFSVNSGSFKQVKSRPGSYTYEIVSYCAATYGYGVGSRYECTSGGDVTVHVAVRE